MRTWKVVALGYALTLSAADASRSESGVPLSVKTLMSPAEFQAAGLTKLTAQELASLDRWLNKYTEAVFAVAGSAGSGPSSRGRAASPPTPAVIETCIDGEFEGWTGETVFKLCNGQIWQQAEYDYMYTYAYRPEVMIYRSGGGYRMKVEDEDDTILVVRLK